MPVRNGRWVSPATIEAEKRAAKAAAAVAETVVETTESAPKAKRSRRSDKATAQAIAAATGVDINAPTIEETDDVQP